MTDIIEKIRARHKACDHIIEWPDFDSLQAIVDNAEIGEREADTAFARAALSETGAA